ncbi:MAG: GAF domain-containing protein [Betaproteobacteria bacterium]|nr:GAF domain-containing protein [Betaproteobacteria bacterium]
MRAVTKAQLLAENERLLKRVAALERAKVKSAARSSAANKPRAGDAAIAAENARLHRKVAARDRKIAEARELQAATSDVLKAISRSTFDLDAVLNTLLHSAARLCGADRGLIFRPDGEGRYFPAVMYHYAPGSPTEVALRKAAVRNDCSSATGRAILERRTIHISDVLADSGYTRRDLMTADAARTVLSVPLLRGDDLAGAITLTRHGEPRPFTDRQIELVTNFANQAVIAIENVRLFNETKESLDRQTAISDIMRVTSNSPSDVQPVLDAVAERAARICEAQIADVVLVEGGALRFRASMGNIERLGATETVPLNRTSVMGRSIIDRRPVHVADLQNVPEDEYPIGRMLARKHGHRTILAVPLIRKDRALGTILLRRTEVRPFDDKHIALLRTFADQAAIAIENVRLFNETKEALERQTATAEILKVIARSPSDVQPVFDAIAASAMRLIGGSSATVARVVGDMLHLAATTATSEAGSDAMRSMFPRPLGTPGLLLGTVARSGKPAYRSDSESDPEVPPEVKELARARGYRSTLAVPMLREGVTIGTIGVARPEPGPFTDHQINLLETFADQAVIAIENVRLFNETKEALERQTASAEILKVISSSSTDLTPVFDCILEHATRLCDAHLGVLYGSHDGEKYQTLAQRGASDELAKHLMGRGPFVPAANSALRKMIEERQSAQFADYKDTAAYRERAPNIVALVDLGGVRSFVVVPMLKEGRVMGGIAIYRREVRPFSEKQVDLVRSFAAQAVIAIENVRLFNETKQALERQTATAEILKVISSSPTDTQPVFDAIARSVVRLCDGLYTYVGLYDGAMLSFVAYHNVSPEALAILRARFPSRPTRGSSAGIAVLDGVAVHIPDVMADPGYQFKDLARADGYRAILAVPMLRGGTSIGIIAVGRRTPFSEDQIGLVRTFADQAVIAIENVRLFNETREALERQTATAEILKVIGSSTTDTQPVFDAIVRSALPIFDGMGIAIARVEGNAIHYVSEGGNTSRARGGFRMPLDRESIAGCAILDRRLVSILDTDAPETPANTRANARVSGSRSLAVAPMMSKGEAVGTITLLRRNPGKLSDRLLDLLKTFADQAAIAIENVRLFNETKESLERQTATAEILNVIASSPSDVQPVFNAIVDSAVRLIKGQSSTVTRVVGDTIQLAAFTSTSDAGNETLKSLFPLPLSHSSSLHARVARTGKSEVRIDVENDPDLLPEGKEMARARGFRSELFVPMLLDGNAIGTINVARREPGEFSDHQINLLKTFADQAVIAIENVRLFNETKEALERQTATSEILRVISSSPTDVQPVFEAIAKSGLHLFEDANVSVVLRDGDTIRAGAFSARDPERIATWRAAFPTPLTRDYLNATAILDNAIVDIPDVDALPRPLKPGTADFAATGFKAITITPMMRGDEAIGAIGVARLKPGSLNDKQIALLETFADQAVIAIENVRLFKEVEARTEALSKTVGQLTALGEVGQAISSTLDIEKVLKTVVTRAVRLTGLDAGVIYEYDAPSELFQLRASKNFDEESVNGMRGASLRVGEGAVGGSVVARKPRQVPDTHAPDYPARFRELLDREGFRAILAVPLLREDQIIGALMILRKEPGSFGQETIELLQTFASQSALAIQNARLFREIAEKGKQLEVASQLKSQFLANMSHELRTPLNAIIGVTEMLHEDAVDLKREDELEPLERVLRAARHLLALINDILDLSKIEAGKMDIHIESFAIAPLINDVVQTIGTMATKNGNEVVVDCAADIGTMNADQTRIRQALLNLASNANKFTEGGKVTIGARRAVEEGREWVTMAVTDTGIGLTPEQMGKLFQEFVQADASTTRKYGGTGLGLAISRRFCQMMGGDITVASELGRGSTFTIRLPAEAGVVQPAAATRADTAPSGASTILVVDDDQTVREMMERYLAREGFSVVTASGGQEGLRLARELHPAAITLDVMMPDLDGWTVLAAIKGDPELADIPVILISIVDEKNRGYALGATDYMVKPVDRARLSGALRGICGSVGRQVLLVDDDETMRQGMRLALEQDGWQVGEAENGQIALARLTEARPDIIMLDLMMPEMDGFEFLVEMRSRAEWRDIPVLVVTAKDLTAGERSRLNGDMERVLQKGASELDELLREIGRILPGSIERGRGRKVVEEKT